ncbi:uncharacterized protein JCM6883_004724 [Sporobolomyces salmoneus]|uniref:uncharacterized protein n=1 Tax=Sporobolomyces salmoneus TaxID=183962 RepID=UPI003175A1EA
MLRLSTIATIIASTFSVASAISVPTTDTISFAAPVTPNHLERRGLINLGALTGKGALIELDVLANILGPNQCTGNAVVGVQASIQIGRLLSICACVEVLGSRRGVTPCPACPANAQPICGSGSCGCECSDGFVSDSVTGVCVPDNACRSSGGRLQHNRDGTSTCQCGPGRVSGPGGVCVLVPSARARANRKMARSQITLDYPSVDGDDHLKCPEMERACPLPSGGYECLDVTSTLDSCGGCPGEASYQNCLTLPGAAGVTCRDSECVIASCFPGWRYLNGRCHRMD